MAKKANKKANIVSKWWFWLLVMAIIAIGILATGLIINHINNSSTTGQALNNDDNKYATPVIPVDVKQKKEYKIAEIASLNGMNVSVGSVTRNYQSPNEYNQPGHGNEFIQISVNIMNESGRKASYSSYDWGVETASGAIVYPAVASYDALRRLDAGYLVNGGTISGEIIFEVPSGDAIKIHYSNPNDYSDDDVVIKV